MKKYIHIQKEDREFIAKAFGISERSTPSGLMTGVAVPTWQKKFASWRWTVAAS